MTCSETWASLTLSSTSKSECSEFGFTGGELIPLEGLGLFASFFAFVSYARGEGSVPEVASEATTGAEFPSMLPYWRGNGKLPVGVIDDALV